MSSDKDISHCVKTFGSICRYCGYYFLIAGILGVIPCLTFGSIKAASYVRIRKERALYDNSTCLLLNYTLLEHKCANCNPSCTFYRCFDETFLMSYPIFNQTPVRSAYSTADRKEKHSQKLVTHII